MRLIQLNLLRRTAVALAAVAGFSIAASSEAAVVTLTGASGTSCSYSSMSVAPDGSFNVQCNGGGPVTPPPPPPPVTGDAGQFDFVNASGTTGVAVFSNYQFPVARTLGTTGVVNIDYTVGGPGCVNGLGTLTFPDGTTSQSAQVMTVANSSTCTITMATPSTSSAVGAQPRLGSVAVMTLTVPSATVTPPPAPGCPAVPIDMASMNIGGLGNPILAMAKSNQIVSMPLPATSAGSTGVVSFSESAGGAYTPQPVTLQISISKCQGVIDTDQNNRCNMTSTNGNYNSVTWFSKAYSVINNSAAANARGYCWAGDGDKYYVNARWTYSQCAFGASVCGFAVQQNLGPY